VPRASRTDSAPSLFPPPSDPESLRASLIAHAEWLRQDAELLQALGLRPEAANVVEFGPIALSRVSEAHRRESDERRRLEAVARANYAAQAQTHAAVIDLMESVSLEDVARRLDDLARIRFGLALGAIAIEGGGGEATPDAWTPLLPGQVDAILGAHRLARLGRCPTAAGLFGALAPQIGSVAILRLQLWRPERLGVIAFGAFDPTAFSAEMGSELVTFLARVVERTAERWPSP
jgi:uncharacterized protein YigA (DUF484 family)